MSAAKPAAQKPGLHFFAPSGKRSLLSELRAAKRRGAKLAEAMRTEHVSKLLAQARDELAKAGHPILCFNVTAAKEEQKFMWRFITVAGAQILTAKDPHGELSRFLGKRRGRPAKDTALRDSQIFARVEERLDNGLSPSVEHALAVVAEGCKLSYESVHQIYYARLKRERRKKGSGRSTVITLAFVADDPFDALVLAPGLDEPN